MSILRLEAQPRSVLSSLESLTIGVLAGRSWRGISRNLSILFSLPSRVVLRAQPA